LKAILETLHLLWVFSEGNRKQPFSVELKEPLVGRSLRELKMAVETQLTQQFLGT